MPKIWNEEIYLRLYTDPDLDLIQWPHQAHPLTLLKLDYVVPLCLNQNSLKYKANRKAFVTEIYNLNFLTPEIVTKFQLREDLNLASCQPKTY